MFWVSHELWSRHILVSELKLKHLQLSPHKQAQIERDAAGRVLDGVCNDALLSFSELAVYSLDTKASDTDRNKNSTWTRVTPINIVKSVYDKKNPSLKLDKQRL